MTDTPRATVREGYPPPGFPPPDELGLRIFLYCLYALTAGGILAVGISEGDVWPGVPVAWGCFAALFSFSAFIRSKWATRRWPFLGPRFDAVPEQPHVLRAEIARLREALLGAVFCEHTGMLLRDSHPDCTCSTCTPARAALAGRKVA